MKFPSSNKGFTIFELLIALTILAVLTAFAAPAFSEFVVKRNITSKSQIITSNLAVARAEALSQLRDVEVCWNSTNANITSDGITIEPGVMSIYSNAVGAVPQIEIKRFEYNSDRIAVFDNEADNCVTYDTQGRLTGMDGTALVIGVCRLGGELLDSKAITVTLAGRAIYQENVDASDGSTRIGCS